MSFDPSFSSPRVDAPEDDSLIVDGLERAVAQARTKIPDHDHTADVSLTAPNEAVHAPVETVLGGLAVDASPVMAVLRGAATRYQNEHPDDVMEVLRGAIDRYRAGDVKDQDAWQEDALARSIDGGSTVSAPPVPRHIAAGYAPDRRRLAAAVVVLFVLVGGFGYQRFSGSDAGTVNTKVRPTLQGHGVTTLPRSTTTGAAVVAPVATDPASTDTTAAPVTGAPSTTVHRSPTTTAPPDTTDTTMPDTTTTTAPTTTTTMPDSTTTTTTTTTDTTLPVGP